LENPLAMMLLDGEIKDGDTVKIYADSDGLQIK
jgi:ATP-dependent Clp protease ATP-binding subunit ClpA